MEAKWSYSGDPSTSTRDQVRFLIGDTEESRKKLGDAEIDWMLTQYTNVYRAASMCCYAIAAMFSDQATYSVGGYSESANLKSREYKARARDLERQSLAAASPVVTGQSVTDKQTDESDTDVVQPAIKRDMMTHPDTGSSSRVNLYDEGW
jgi:hypothetical protein